MSIHLQTLGMLLGKKDPGVPNSCPFKEDVLKEAEQRKIKVYLAYLLNMWSAVNLNIVCLAQK